jgi:hypothetical protein
VDELKELRSILADFRELFKEISWQWKEVCEKTDNQNQLTIDLEREIDRLEEKVDALTK